MYVYEEMINGKKLTDIINETHENVKYLPGHKLPENVVSTFLLSLCLVFINKYKVFHSYITFLFLIIGCDTRRCRSS